MGAFRPFCRSKFVTVFSTHSISRITGSAAVIRAAEQILLRKGGHVMGSWKSLTVLALASMSFVAPSGTVTLGAAETVQVDGTKGDDKNPGSAQRPLRSISAALA